MLTLAAGTAAGQNDPCELPMPAEDEIVQACPAIDPQAAFLFTPEVQKLLNRLRKYDELEERHRLSGLASYYSSFFDGRRTANGEIYRNRRVSAAHLTLPLGTWIEVTARKSGRKLRLRVNDRGPYASKFMLDLSQAAAKRLGVDVGNRQVDVRVIALPGEDPIEGDYDTLLAKMIDRDGTGAEVPELTVAAR
jgi:rare lipoprotein A (peptidoglycan hydrolase)